MSDLSAGGTRRDEVLIGAMFVVSFLSGIAFAVVFVLHWQTQVDGAIAAIALGSFGAALVLWGHRLLTETPAEDAREPLASRPEDIVAFEEALDVGGVLERRTALRRLLLAGIGGLVAAAVFPIRSLGPRPRPRPVWRKGVALVDSSGRRIYDSNVPRDSLLTAFPASDPADANGPMLLIRVDPELLHTGDRASWSPGGLVAFSKICTHAGCPVGLYEAQSHTLLCPCHQSIFDVLHEGRPTSGPAAAPLPQLPLAVACDGSIVASGPPSAPIGPASW